MQRQIVEISSICQLLQARRDVGGADRELINTIKTLKPELFAQKIINEYAKWQICGAAPIIALLKTTNYTDTSLEYYGQWYEHYYDSLVSFAAISFK